VELREIEQFASSKIEPDRNIWHCKTLYRSDGTRYDIAIGLTLQ
jgi:hypothetical protein